MSESPTTSSSLTGSLGSPTGSLGSPTQRIAFGFAPSTKRKRGRKQRRARAKAWEGIDLAQAITQTTDPLPPSNAPINPTPILSPPENDGFFVLASCMFHACVSTEADPRTHPPLVQTRMIETVRCPAHLRIIAQNNLGFYHNRPGNFMDAMMSVMRNQMSASGIIKETANVSLRGIVNLSEEKKVIDLMMERADPEETQKLSRLKKMVETECSKMRTEIVQLTHAALDDVERNYSPFKQLALVFDHSDRCNRLVTSLTYGIMTLLRQNGAKYTESHLRCTVNQMDRGNFISYGDPKTRYLPTKTYSLTAPFPALQQASAADRFIARHLDGKLHLSVGLRLDGHVHTLQANVDLRALKAGTPMPDIVTMHEIVQLLMDPRLKARIVELMREQHPHLTAKPLDKSGWDVALYDGGCSGIQGSSNCPFTVHVPSSSDKRRKMALLSADLPTEQAVPQPNAVPWELERSRSPRFLQTVHLRKADEYLAPGESPFRVKLSAFFQPTIATATTTATATTRAATREERSSNESTTTEPPQTPQGTLEEGGGRRIKFRRIKTRRIKTRRKPKKTRRMK